MRHRLPQTRRPRALGLILACTVGCLGSASLAAPAAAAAAAGRVVVLHPHRQGLDGPSEVWVYRPPVPDSAVLPVLYFLHGHPGQPGDVFHAGLKRAIEHHLARGGAPFVIAAPDGNSSLHADTEWADASDGSDQVESFLLQTVVPLVEGSHPRPPALRAIGGFSMGGYGAINIALRHPALFGQIVSIAGYYKPDDPSNMFGTSAALLANTPEANLAGARGKRILLLEDRGETLPLIRGQSFAFKGLLERAGIRAVLSAAPGRHDLNYAIRELGVVSRFLGRGFAAVSAPPADAPTGAPPPRVAGRAGG